MECGDPAIPVDDRNLMIKAAKLLSERFSVDKGTRLRLEKNIPSPGGLGGGSSNAAVTLLGLNKLWGIDAEISELLPIAAELGSDVPFFLTGGTAVGVGRGEVIEPIEEEFRSEAMIIVTPPISVSTADAFKLISNDGLTKKHAGNTLIVCRFDSDNWVPEHATLQNDFEKPIFGLYPEIEHAKQWLLDNGAVEAAMSGSGASVAGFFDNKETRQTALKALGNKANWRSFAVATISRDQYREALKQVF